jgi:hypothetical protein
MGIQVRINRDKRKHRWSIHSLDHKRRLGWGDGLLLRDVTFVSQPPSGWADGELWGWAAIQVDPKFSAAVEARMIENMELTWSPLEFRGGQFFAAGDTRPLVGCLWLQIQGSEARVAGGTY